MYNSDIQHPTPALHNKLRALYTLAKGASMDLSFRPPFLNLLEKLGNPHLNLPPVIHVAGTNGKGSTIATLRAILEAAGERVHVYTSPHLIRFNERIVLGGREITDEALEPLIDLVLEANAGADITFFEVTTALAFKAFAETPADYLLLEVGLGGRLDCTNIIPTSALSLITRIGLDHQAQLGNTLPQIALEKAGIMKAGTTCLVGAQEPEALSAIQDHANKTSAPLHIIDTDAPWPNDFDKPALHGDHQYYNAHLAVAAARTLLPEISDDHISHGLKHTYWPARLQNIYPPALSGHEVWLDGGHNGDAGAALRAQIMQWQSQDGQDNNPLYLILGMMNHKDPKAFLAPFIDLADQVHIVPIPFEVQSITTGEVNTLFPDQNAVQHTDLHHTLIHIAQEKQGRVLICGSLYLAGHVLETLK